MCSPAWHDNCAPIIFQLAKTDTVLSYNCILIHLGSNGSTGAKGDTGVQGEKGEPGSGENGVVGPQGFKGKHFVLIYRGWPKKRGHH